MGAEPTARERSAARSVGVFSGSEVGFSFTGLGNSDRGYAQLGPERNGIFLR